jgi:hypothetical protein
MKQRKKLDTLLTGLVPGLVLPVITLLIIWVIRYSGSFREFLATFQEMNMLSKVISLASIPNLLLFFIFIWTDRNFSARGVIFATLMVAAVMLVLKFA